MDMLVHLFGNYHVKWVITFDQGLDLKVQGVCCQPLTEATNIAVIGSVHKF